MKINNIKKLKLDESFGLKTLENVAKVYTSWLVKTKDALEEYLEYHLTIDF